MKKEASDKKTDHIPEPARAFLSSFRKDYSTDDVIHYLKKLRSVRALVIGETILDEYHHVAAIGKPPKGNHIAAKYLRQEVHAGGVLACANHMANFCSGVDLVTAIGREDDSEKFIRSHLKANVQPNFFYQNRTIIKRRFVDHAYSNKLFEVYENEELHTSDISDKIADRIRNEVAACAEMRYDLIVVLDYGHGLFGKSLIDAVCSLPCFLAVNAQTNTSNFGYNLITKYPRANYFCLDEWELRLAYQDRYGDIGPLMSDLSKRTTQPGGMVCVTLGHRGAVSLADDKLHEVPVFSKNVVDTTGAGDAFLAITAPCVAKGLPAGLTTFVGNTMGALAVEYLGNKSSIEADALYRFIRNLLN